MKPKNISTSIIYHHLPWQHILPQFQPKSGSFLAITMASWRGVQISTISFRCHSVCCSGHLACTSFLSNTVMKKTQAILHCSPVDWLQWWTFIIDTAIRSRLCNKVQHNTRLNRKKAVTSWLHPWQVPLPSSFHHEWGLRQSIITHNLQFCMLWYLAKFCRIKAIISDGKIKEVYSTAALVVPISTIVSGVL